MQLNLGANNRTESILLDTRDSVKEIAADHECSLQTVRNIKYMRTVDSEYTVRNLQSRGLEPFLWSPRRKWTDAELKAIRTSTETSAKLARKYEVAPSTIRMIRTGKTNA